MQVLKSQEEWTLTNMDRCDAECSAQAFIKAIGVGGELMFCSHHYNNIVNNAIGYHQLEKFAYNIVDERERLVENRLQGQD